MHVCKNNILFANISHELSIQVVVRLILSTSQPGVVLNFIFVYHHHHHCDSPIVEVNSVYVSEPVNSNTYYRPVTTIRELVIKPTPAWHREGRMHNVVTDPNKWLHNI